MERSDVLRRNRLGRKHLAALHASDPRGFFGNDFERNLIQMRRTVIVDRLRCPMIVLVFGNDDVGIFGPADKGIRPGTYRIFAQLIAVFFAAVGDTMPSSA